MTTLAYIALGSNLDDPQQQLRQAVGAIEALENCQLLSVSSYYRSAPLGPSNQPDYINAVAVMETRLAPLELLDQLQSIEKAQGRQRQEHWGPRTLDLDILLYGELTIAQHRLTIPHPQMTTRNFVLHPLFEISPDIKLPDGTAVKQLLENVGSEGIVRLSTPDTNPPLMDVNEA